MPALGTASTITIGLNTWYQIHTNGAGTTFARIYQGQDENGFGCFWFEKMSVDTGTHMGYAEIFGRESFTSELTAHNRLERALTESL
jgi:hypothetical protein